MWSLSGRFFNFRSSCGPERFFAPPGPPPRTISGPREQRKLVAGPKVRGSDVGITEARGLAGVGGGREPPETHSVCRTRARGRPSEARPRAAPEQDLNPKTAEKARQAVLAPPLAVHTSHAARPNAPGRTIKAATLSSPGRLLHALSASRRLDALVRQLSPAPDQIIPRGSDRGTCLSCTSATLSSLDRQEESHAKIEKFHGNARRASARSSEHGWTEGSSGYSPSWQILGNHIPMVQAEKCVFTLVKRIKVGAGDN